MSRDLLRRLAVLLSAVVLLVAAGCGDDEEEGDGADAEPKVLTITASGAPKALKLEVPPSAVSGVTEIRLRNDSRVPQSAQLVRVEGNRGPEEVGRVIRSEGGPIPSWITDGAGVGETEPGKTGVAIADLRAGRYVIFGGGGDEEEGPPPTAVVTVRADGGGGELPQTDAKIDAKDYSFTATGLKRGRQQVEFANTGKELHHVIGFPLRPGATLAQARRFLQTERGRPPFEERGNFETAVIDGGQRQVTTLDLRPGKYALVCFIQDRRGGPPHIAKGMISEATVE